MFNRRQFNKSVLVMAFAGLSKNLSALPLSRSDDTVTTDVGYGPLLRDEQGILDLPAGFSYQIISQLGDTMSDGLPVPDRADGMGCFALDANRVVLIRNHELPQTKARTMAEDITAKAYDTNKAGQALPGGTTSLIYNLQTGQLESQFRTLIGTIRNCSVGITPWNSWLSCEETMVNPSSQNRKSHGYIFEVPASATGLIDAKPLTAMGRFNHESACVDPRSGIVYLTEDRGDSLFYRFIPTVRGQLHAGGKLQALAIRQQPQFDTRNWDWTRFPQGQTLQVEWIDLDKVDSPEDDLRLRGYQQGAALFARGEGVHWAGEELYFCCTNGGAKQLGQIMCYRPSLVEGQADERHTPGRLSLFVESENKVSFNFGDNLTVAPDGQLIVCEDQYTDVVDNHLKGVTQDGELYDFARIRLQTEPAGACFSPDGHVLFVNLYSPTRTLAIRGPWQHLAS